MDLRRKGPAIIIGVVGIIIGLYVLSANAALERIASQTAKERLDSLTTLLQGQLETSRNGTEARAEMIAAIPGIPAALADRDRKALLELISPPLEKARTRLGIDQAQFAAIDGTLVVRLDDPDKFGDDIRHTKPTMMASMDRGETMAGVEISRRGPQIVGVAPVMRDGKTIGCFEVGLPFVPAVDGLKRLQGIEAAVLFDEQRLLHDAPEMSGQIAADAVIGRFAKTYSSDWPLVQSCLKGRTLDGSAPSAFVCRLDKTEFTVSTVPITDSRNQLVGWLVGCREQQDAQGRTRRAFAVQLFLGIFALILVSGVVRIVLNGMIMRPIVGLTQAAGDREALAEYARRPDEIGALARQMRREDLP